MKTRSKAVKRMLTLVLTLCMLFAMVLPVGATDTLTAAEDPRESVMTISLGIQDDEGTYVPVIYGTCFLVNDEYVLTNNHCVTPDSEFLAIAAQAFGTEIRANDSHIRCYVHITRDIMVEGTVHENVRSDVMDFALVKLNEKIYDRKPLALGDSDSVKIKDRVYAMGFPADSVTTREYFTKADVSVTEGSIAKVTESGSENLFEHTATLNYGNSGGPLVNESDQVIGINVGMTNSKYYAIQINFIKSTMDTFGIPYVDASATPVVEEVQEEDEEEEIVVDKSALSAVLAEAKAIDVEGYTDESVAALNDAIGKAETIANNSDAAQAAVDSATDSVNQAIANLEEKAGINFVLIGGIAAGVIVVIIIVVLIIVLTSSKKQNAAPMQPQMPPQFQQQVAPQLGQTVAPAQQPQVAPMQTAAPMAEPEGAGETTLLDAGAGETTLLSGGGSSAYLIRKKNGEKIMLNNPNFKIGKERRRVNYCVSDNTSVSRVHCEIVRKGADFYAVDQGSTNFTFVNGVQLSPRQETLLSDCSVLKISDEEFEFHLS